MPSPKREFGAGAYPRDLTIKKNFSHEQWRTIGKAFSENCALTKHKYGWRLQVRTSEKKMAYDLQRHLSGTVIEVRKPRGTQYHWTLQRKRDLHKVLAGTVGFISKDKVKRWVEARDDTYDAIYKR